MNVIDMKQVFQNLKDGDQIIEEVPIPSLRQNQILVKSICSLISPGTEGMLALFGRSNIFDKAKQQPEKVKAVIDKVSSDGLLETYDAVKNKIEEPIPLGYSNVGKVISVGNNVKGFKVGDRVASNGPHAEVFAVNQNLCALIPDNVSNERAVFTVIASIGLNGIRLAKPSFGETFLVSGLGLIGLLTSQILSAQGCQVLGIDPDEERCSIANSFGIKTLNISKNADQVLWCLQNTNNVGIDGAIVTAAANSSEPINLAAKACRKKGRIILVGATPINLRRNLFYEKELIFKVSCSYGPGRYDKFYEEEGNDYPIGYVRWTEKRNFESIIHSFSKNNLNTDKLVSHKFKFDEINKAYEVLLSKEKSLGIIINYPNEEIKLSEKVLFKEIYEKNKGQTSKTKKPFIGFIGSGNYAKRTLIPSFSKSSGYFHSLVSPNGSDSIYVGRKYAFPILGTDVDIIFNDINCNTVVIATRHDSHAKLILRALDSGKNVFVEKPLCLTRKELDCIKNKYNEIHSAREMKPILMVGFNRRFSPLVKQLKSNLDNLNNPKSFLYTCNAGFIKNDHWIHDPNIGGGRFLGEACHFLDLIRFLADSPIKDMDLISTPNRNHYPDNFILQVKFNNGSIAAINYFNNGIKSYPKERLEVFCSGTIHKIDNFKKLTIWGSNKFKNKRLIRQDKGQVNCAKEFIDAIKKGGNSPIAFNQLIEVQDWLLKVNDNFI